MKKLIGYVGTRDLGTVEEADAVSLDVINIAFGQIENGTVIWEHPECVEPIKRLRMLNPKLKLVLSVGGWSAGGFSEAARTKQGRKIFSDSAAAVIEKYGLDGIDIDWEYPCINVAGIGADPSDKQNYTLLLGTLRETLDARKEKEYLVTTAVGGDEYFVRCTEMDKVSDIVDYVQLMTYDLRGGFQTLTGHHTGLYGNQADLFGASTDHAVRCFMAAGVPCEKLVIGAAFYSREWKEVPDVSAGLHQMAATTGGYGPDYHTLVEKFINKNGYQRYWDEEAKAPYLFNGTHFISYEDKESIAHKAAYVKEMNLLGMMYWEYCCDMTRSLTGWMRKELK